MKIILTIFFFVALFMVTVYSSMIIEAEALSERDKEIVAAGYALQAEKIRINELQKERFDAIGRGDISVELCQSTFCDQSYTVNSGYYSAAYQAAQAKIQATGSQVTYQDNQYVNDKDILNDPFLPIIDPVLIGFLAAIFITSIYIGRQFSRKKRIARRNRRDWKHRSHDEPGILRVTPEEYRRMQEFERSFVTLGKSDPEYFLHVTSGARLVDASRRGNELYSIDTIIHGRSLRILKYRDPSTKVQDPITGELVGQLYISFVPEHINKADHGMAWKFRLTPGEYRRTKRHEA